MRSGGRVGCTIAAAFVVAAAGCDSGRARPTSAARGKAAAGSSTALPRPLDGVCAPRTLGPDPGPTNAADDAQRLDPPADVADVKDQCVKHAECTERPHGRCVHQAEHEVQPFGRRRLIPAHNECVYDECESDDECRRTTTYEPRAESVCTCSDERNMCTFANCRVDSDCPPPFPCGAWHYCHSAADACRERKDCKAEQSCVYSWTAKHYVCETPDNTAPD